MSARIHEIAKQYNVEPKDMLVWLKEQGATMPVQQALQTPGALLFHFDSEPQPGLGSEPPVAREHEAQPC